MSDQDAINQYVDPTKGYWGKSKMMRKYRRVLNKMYALQRHKEVTSKTKKKHYTRESTAEPFMSVQLDLAFLPKLQSPINNNIIGFMVVVDVFSRYLWVKPLTNRKSLHIPLESVLKQMKAKFGKTPINMTGDNEFATTQLQALAAKYDFRWWFGDANEKFRTGIAERVIRTIKNLIKRYLTQNNTTKYIDVLHTLVANYNDTIHDSTHTRPGVAIKTGQSFPVPMQNSYGKKRVGKKIDTTLHIGDRVRIINPRKRGFTKGDVPYYSEHVYQVIGKEMNRYKLRNMESNKTPKQLGYKPSMLYGRHQLQKVSGEVIKAKYKPNQQDVGYDEGIRRQQRVNRNKRSLNRMGIDLNNIIDTNERNRLNKQINEGIDEQITHEKNKEKKKQLQKKKNKQYKSQPLPAQVVRRNPAPKSFF